MSYYKEKLSGSKLERCYNIAPLRIKRYLYEEINYVISILNPSDSVVELGCGYGRVIGQLAKKSQNVIGIDTSLESLRFASNQKDRLTSIMYAQTNATQLGFKNNIFDVVVCIQNGICAFGVNHRALIKEAVRVTRIGGTIIFSSYSSKIWEDRLKWFEIQSNNGLLGEIDYEKTKNGTIVCKDGFHSSALTKSNFQQYCQDLDLDAKIFEVDDSSIMCQIMK